MNLFEINRLIASLQEASMTCNKELIEFYRRKRDELVQQIAQDVAKKIKEIE